MKKIKKPVSGKGKLMMSLATAGMLTLGTLGAALADTSNQTAGQDTGGRQGLFGSVTAKGAKSFTLLTRSGASVELMVTERTKFRIPGDSDPGFDDVSTGARVAVLALREANGLIALQVAPAQAQPQREHRVLTVVDIAGRTLTAQDAQGNQVTVELDREISPDLKGQLAVFIGEHSQQSDRFKANAEVKIERVVERLETHAARLHKEADAERDEAVKARKERDASLLVDRLEANQQKRLERLDEVIAQAPDQARDALEQARERFRLHQEQTRERFQKEMDQARTQFQKEMAQAREQLQKERDQVHEQLRKEMEQARQHLKEQLGRPLDRPETGAVAPRPGPRAVQGVVQAVDASAGKLILMTVDGRVVTLEVGADLEIRLGDRTVPLAEVATGNKVTVHYNKERSAVDAVQIKNESWEVVMGTLMSVEPDAGVVTVGTREGSVRTVKVGSSAPQVRAAIKELANLRPGTEVTIKYRVSGGEVIELAFGRMDGGPAINRPMPAPTDQQMEQKRLQEQERMEREKLLARFHEEQKLALANFHAGQEKARFGFQEQQGLALKRFLEEQRQALARFQEQNKEEPALARFMEEQRLALARLQEEHAQALTRLQGEQEQSRARFQEEQKLALIRFLEEQRQALARFQAAQQPSVATQPAN